MKYYIGGSSRISKRKRIGQALLYILAYSAAFAIAFFISYKLVSATQTNAQKEVVELRAEVTALNTKLAEKEDLVGTLQMQVTSLEGELAESQRKYEELEKSIAEAATPPVIAPVKR